MHQENVAIKTKQVYISSLAYLSKFFDYKKPFKETTGKDIAEYLGSMHRDQTVDPDQKWVNTHNMMPLSISKFYRWVAYPHQALKKRKTEKGSAAASIKKLSNLCGKERVQKPHKSQTHLD